jgi:hypothetical protein
MFKLKYVHLLICIFMILLLCILLFNKCNRNNVCDKFTVGAPCTFGAGAAQDTTDAVADEVFQNSQLNDMMDTYQGVDADEAILDQVVADEPVPEEPLEPEEPVAEESGAEEEAAEEQATACRIAMDGLELSDSNRMWAVRNAVSGWSDLLHQSGRGVPVNTEQMYVNRQFANINALGATIIEREAALTAAEEACKSPIKCNNYQEYELVRRVWNPATPYPEVNDWGEAIGPRPNIQVECGCTGVEEPGCPVGWRYERGQCSGNTCDPELEGIKKMTTNSGYPFPATIAPEAVGLGGPDGMLAARAVAAPILASNLAIRGV